MIMQRLYKSSNNRQHYTTYYNTVNMQLSQLFKLPSNVKIYVPSTVNATQSTDTAAHVNNTLTKLSQAFGGSTAYQATGAWTSDTHGLIKETVTVCQSFTTPDKLEEFTAEIIAYCQQLKTELSQEAISLEINNELYFI